MELLPQNPWTIFTALPLLLCSILALALIAERTLFLLSKRRLKPADQHAVLTALKQADVAQAETQLLAIRPFYEEALTTLIRHKDQEKALRDCAVSLVLEELASQLKNRLSGLMTITTLAPMLGLLGTIIGLMRAFYDLGRHHGPVEPAIVADGLWQAMSTTAAGMIIAICCTLAHALMQSRIKRDLAQSSQILNRLSQLHAVELSTQNHSGYILKGATP
ncbi:MotA/TolQ/ExbB proton channel family protein [Iodobacter ciconiae]|uniref:MotA/TolQ/ExbB proton channel family protein n=1 Tax=Iodobacter ciconiae TaxID=2496266 RepID=A0A3S8ZUK0_9NEIS|nr:MotA/TolQ/ExbB proton channel family protein [Iodobacter ciconiae]AZN37152.1 MotA/TolQ/ExbB proton channel family protein [Iodobacter ciconiae]